ncbi:DUF4303 domain-containing protein [Urbifossiella limnaea]|uniref:DUF4303 domain-containing protein n=1 Tax=Urbifossiella limnaea TaxID=2528023 RepID=A0A517Y262_9BACT|nr:DUF4303 domain-containing protein [Urbifossiella limnaea]QDU23824.1 hypothetical protein ETAA1_58320 [Urbifossiella limnaea]
MKEDLLAAIRDSLASGAKTFLAEFRAAWPNETMYSFLFELPPEGSYACAAAATEEGLTRVVKKYAAKGYAAGLKDATAALQKWLRWAGPEDGWFQGLNSDAFVPTSKLLDEAFAAEWIKPFDGQLESLAQSALRHLDTEGVFGTGEGREAVVLGVCNIGGDNSDEDFFAWAEEVNPPTVMQRLRREVLESRSMSDRIPSPGWKPPTSGGGA